jgi:hypothetical protein
VIGQLLGSWETDWETAQDHGAAPGSKPVLTS